GRRMLYELRTYTFTPGKMPGYLKLAEEVGSKVRGDRYGKRLGTWTAEIGLLNQVWHLWEYESYEERTRLRAELSKNRDWTEGFVANIRPLLARQEIRFMNALLPFKAPETTGNVYELRLYRAHVGAVKRWTELFKAIMPVREKYSPNVCAWTVEAADPNAVVHLWAYKDLNARSDARDAAVRDPEWQAFLAEGTALLAEMQSVVMLPTAVSPLK
ncbi:MAG: NIPSNAP family protein, partial [Alphaproteobacteria bacterium]